MRRTEQVVIITGATGNLGAATARAFQAAGARTVLVDRSSERLKQQFVELADSDQHLLAGGVDLTDPVSLDGAVQRALARFGRIDAAVHTVGAWRGGQPVHETDPADWDFLFGVNLRTPARSAASAEEFRQSCSFGSPTVRRSICCSSVAMARPSTGRFSIWLANLWKSPANSNARASCSFCVPTRQPTGGSPPIPDSAPA